MLDGSPPLSLFYFLRKQKMAKNKLTLSPEPTFKADVTIPVPGGKAAVVEFVFKYRDRDGFKEFIDSLGGGDDVDVIMDMASGWDLADPFDRANVEKLAKLYMAAPMAIMNAYTDELTGARLKN